MAEIIRQFTATIPANTPNTALYSTAFTIPGLIVVSVDLEVPPGPMGLMHFYLALGGVQAIPWDGGEYLTWDDTIESWPLDGYSTAGTWEIVGYNDDDNDHDVTARFHCNAPTASSPPPPTLQIVAAPTLSPAGVTL